jgi:hypothetical protein
MENIQVSKTRIKFISGFIRQEVMFKPSMPLVVLVEEDCSDLEIDLPLYIVFALLLWDMEDMYGSSKGPH